MLPNVPACIIIPIAAFSLTLRPLIVAATSEVVLGLDAGAPHPCQVLLPPAALSSSISQATTHPSSHPHHPAR